MKPRKPNHKSAAFRNRKQSWADKLSDRRWLALSFRLKSERGECAACGETKDLEVHHAGYSKDWTLQPWEYDDLSLIVLCSSCHKALHGWTDSIWNNLLRMNIRYVGEFERLFQIMADSQDGLKIERCISAIKRALYKSEQEDRLMNLIFGR